MGAGLVTGSDGLDCGSNVGAAPATAIQERALGSGAAGDGLATAGAGEPIAGGAGTNWLFSSNGFEDPPSHPVAVSKALPSSRTTRIREGAMGPLW